MQSTQAGSEGAGDAPSLWEALAGTFFMESSVRLILFGGESPMLLKIKHYSFLVKHPLSLTSREEPASARKCGDRK